ncbi:MAG: FAD-dependent oxidoreductase, partial [Proteobacteria bacterium]|nr:FAD-dependent oxidoreductase [Pseudomonadota bacterium]
FDLPDDELEKRVRLDLDRVLGLRHEPETVRIHRWPRAIPQPGTDHVQRVAEVRRRIPPSTGLALAGAHLDGIALGDAVVSGVRAAATLLEER